jgi:phosphatidylglycerophosphatase A
VKSLVRFLATLGPAGHSPVVPATVGSALVALAGYFLPVPPLAVTVALLALGTAAAIWVCGEAEKELGHDAKPIVADEAVGQSLALLFVPHAPDARAPLAFAAAFLLFRLLDVWKPLGAREVQRLPGGWGVVADDVIAGLAACGAFHLLWWAARVAGWMR